MIPQALSRYHLPGLSCVGLLIFFGVFVGALAWVFRKGSRSFYEARSSMPLQD